MFVEFLDFCFWRTTSVTKLRPACGAPHALAKGVQLRDETRSDLYSLLPIRAWRFWKMWKGKKTVWKHLKTTYLVSPQPLVALSLSLSVPAALQEVLRSTAITCNQITATGNRWPWGAIGFIEDGIVDVAASLPELPRAWWLPHFLECGNWQLFRNDPKIHWSWISLMNPAEFASARQPNASWGVTLRGLWETRGIWYRMYPAVTSWCETSSSRVYTWSCYPAGHHARTSTTKLK